MQYYINVFGVGNESHNLCFLLDIVTMVIVEGQEQLLECVIYIKIYLGKLLSLWYAHRSGVLLEL